MIYGWIIVIGGTVALSILFIYKLFKMINRDIQRHYIAEIDENDQILSLMIKLTILVLMSMFFSILVPLSRFVIVMDYFPEELFFTLDIYARCMCVMLPYKVNEFEIVFTPDEKFIIIIGGYFELINEMYARS